MPSVVDISAQACRIAALLTMSTATCSANSDNTSSIETQTNGSPPASYAMRLPASSTDGDRSDLNPTRSGADQWAGTYTYAFNGGANAAGTQTVVTYTLELSAATCKLTAQGYQTEEIVLCSTKPLTDGIDVAFKSYGDGELTDKYGNAVYSVGDPLFSLQRVEGKIVTRWKGYPLPDDQPHPVGVYFHT